MKSCATLFYITLSSQNSRLIFGDLSAPARRQALSMSTRGKIKSFGLYPLPLFGRGRYLSVLPAGRQVIKP